jgi:hypothetical protein
MEIIVTAAIADLGLRITVFSGRKRTKLLEIVLLLNILLF